MILWEILQDEAHPAYQQLEIENGNRHYDFLRSLVIAALATGKPFLSSHAIKALNFQAITCLHTNPGEYRPCAVTVGKAGADGIYKVSYTPPEHYRVQALMDDFVNTVNRAWETTDEVALATFVLWRLNHIHPFINGNGRTARAAAYFVLCMKSGGWLPGKTILPELIRRERDAYCVALAEADKAGDLKQLHELVSKLLKEQLQSAEAPPAPAPPAPAAPAGK